MKITVKSKILKALNTSHTKGLDYNKLKEESKAKNNIEFKDCLIDLIDDGEVINIKDIYYSPSSLGLYRAKIIKNLPTFCFGENIETKKHIFIPGRFSKGAILGDHVLISPLIKKKDGDLDEGEVRLIYKKNNQSFTGVLLKENGKFYVKPDKLSRDLIEVSKDSVLTTATGDKVVAVIKSRGLRHSEHICEIVSSLGSSQKASICARALLESSGAKIEFPKTVYNDALRLSKREISGAARKVRLDLTDWPIFTIDSAHSKDLDDAVSIKKEQDCYKVGVHIADVAHYVKFRSPLDIEAYQRGTSIYYANHVIPMLPEPLSNGICSLNENVERLALSVIMEVGFDGKINNFTFKKTIIKSRVKGVYSEINEILDNNASDEIKDKYKDVMEEINLMYELYNVLKSNKIERGSPQLETSETKIILDENENAIDIKPAQTGTSQGMVEEFMLLANEAAAILAKRKGLPFVFRIHEQPSPEKISTLKEMVDKLGLNSKEITPKIKPYILSDLLEKTRNTDLFPIMNMQVLRSMAKARYFPDPIGHYGLALKNYAHFTSPIRRYPDLMVHRILTDYVSHKDSVEVLRKKYQKFVLGASNRATETEKKAMEIERGATDCYKAEYMKSHIGEEYEGIITSIINKGMFVGLKNTIEGYVKVENLKGYFEYDGFTRLYNKKTGLTYRIGQVVKIKCVGSDVNSGKVDFEIIEN